MSATRQGEQGMTRDRLLALIEDERFLLDALNQAYDDGLMHYASFSPAFDASAARIFVLQNALEAMDATPSKGTPNV